LTTCRTPIRSAISRSFARLAAKKRPAKTIAAELFHPVLPALGAQTQPLEDPDQLCRDRGFSLANESARIFDQNSLRTQRDTQ
jgi:hypothetical protein